MIASSTGAAAIGALAIGAVAVGAFAIGALAIRRLLIGRVLVQGAKFKSLEIQELTVNRLRVAEVTVSDSLKLPGSNLHPKWKGLVSYDLGEDLRMVLLSVTEGEDKPLKYPTIFNTADVAVITKNDLAQACDFDRDAARRNIQAVRPGMQVFEVSAKTGQGMSEWLQFLKSRGPSVTLCSCSLARAT